MMKYKIEFRCTLYEKKLLKFKAKRAGLTLSDFCRKSVKDQVVIERLTKDQSSHYKMLVTYHNNFKRIGNLVKTKHPDLFQNVLQTSEDIKRHLKNFKS